MASASEFSLIERIRRRAGGRADVALGIGDDAALLRPPPGQALVVSTDTLNAGVHFPPATAPADLGWKALAVNLSDLAAMAAEPAWCTLSLSLRQADLEWLEQFLDGFLALADSEGVALIGGDTTGGPLSIAVIAIGFVPETVALRRSAARVGDEVWVTGTLGDAAAALALGDPAATGFLAGRLNRPTPRVAAGLALRGLAHAAIDVSDGLVADLGHILERSGVGAELAIAALPTSAALAAVAGEAQRRRWQLEGGDDYELCFTAPPGRAEAITEALAATGTPAVRIRQIRAATGLRVIAPDGRDWRTGTGGFQHF